MTLEFRREIISAELLDPRKDFAAVTHEMEFRYDPLTGRSTRLAHFGAITPQPLNYDKYDGENKGFCPFCPPNMERVTSLFPRELVPEGRLRIGDASLIANIAPYDAYSGLVVLGDKHVLTMAELTADLLRDAFSAALRFLGYVRRFDPEVPYYFLGWNYMPPSGGGLVHPHIQVFGSKDPGNVFMEALRATGNYRKNNGRSFWSDYLAEEQKLAERLVGNTGGIKWLVPFAPLGVLGDVLAVGPQNCTPQDLTDTLLEDVVAGLVRLFAYYQVKGVYSFNASVHFSPESNGEFPLLLRFSPRTFLNTKFCPPDTNFFHVMLQQPICVVRPEELAAEVRPFFS